jgi:hypothetical protein
MSSMYSVPRSSVLASIGKSGGLAEVPPPTYFPILHWAKELFF